MNEIIQESCKAYLDLYSVMYEYTASNSIITSNMDNPNIETIIEGVVSKWTSVMKQKLGNFKEKILELIKKIKDKVSKTFLELTNRNKSQNSNNQKNDEKEKPTDDTTNSPNKKENSNNQKNDEKEKPTDNHTSTNKKIKDYRLKEGVQYCIDNREEILKIIKKIEIYTENEEYIENDEERESYNKISNRITEKYTPRLNKLNDSLNQSNISKAFNLSTDNYVKLTSHATYEDFKNYIKEENFRLIKMLNSLYSEMETKLNTTMKYLDSKAGNIKTKEFNSSLSSIIPVLNQSVSVILTSINIELQAIKTISNSYLF